MGHSYWSLGPVCWKHSSQSACSSSQSSCSSSLETVFSLPSSGGRPTCTADSLFHSTWCCMAPNQGRWNRKSDFSNTFELGRDAYRETVEQYLSRSSHSTKFSSSCNQVRRQPFWSLYRSTIFRLQCSKCLQTWTFMVVQSNWSWLPTILLLGFYVDVSERTIISAGTLRLRLSGLKSRAHLIREYSFPSCIKHRVRCTHYLGYMYRKASLCQIFTARCGRQIPAAIGLCV